MLLSVLLLIGAFSAAPQSSPTPLKTISHIHASPFCTTMRQNIGHAMLGVMKNDAAIAQGKAMFLQLAQDTLARRSAIDLDMERMSGVVGDMVNNLAATDAALNDLRAIPNDPKTDDDKRLAQMRDELRAVADRQREALNVFSGTYYSFKSNELMGAGNPLARAVAPTQSNSMSSASTSEADTPIVVPTIKPAPLPSASAAPLPSASPGTTVDLGLVGYDARTQQAARLFNSLTTIQLHEQPLESRAAQTIIQYANDCK